MSQGDSVGLLVPTILSNEIRLQSMQPKRTKRASTPTEELSHRWYLPEHAAIHGKRQADAERDLGWSRAKTSDLWNLKQRYTQESVDEAANWLGIRPYELLMPPEDAERLRKLEQLLDDHARLLSKDGGST